MMNRSWVLGLVVGLAGLWTAPAALAQKHDGEKADRGAGKAEKGDKGDRAKGDKGGDRQKKGGGLEALLKAMDSELKLSGEQQAEVKKLFTQYAEKQKKAKQEMSKEDREAQKKELKDLQAQLQQAKKNKDTKKMEEIMGKLKSMKEDAREKNAVDPAFLESVSKALKADQRDKFWELVAEHVGGQDKGIVGKYREVLGTLGLSKEQQQATDKILKDFEKNVGSDKGGEAGKEAAKKLRTDIEAQLNESQKTAFHKAMKGSGKGESRGGKADRGGAKGEAGGKKARGGDEKGK